MPRPKTGLQRVYEGLHEPFLGKRLGLLAHPASICADGSKILHALDVFSDSKFQLKALFGPQHGWAGDTQDNMIEWEGNSEGRIPLYSLYGRYREPTREMLSELDAIVVDLQDVGCRVYTFIQTLYLVMKAAQQYNKEVIVLDRPNPIGNVVENPGLNLDYATFVGFSDIALRHGKTMAELAKIYNKKFRCRLNIVEMQGYNRGDYFDQTGLTWVAPSPNIPTLDTAMVYPGSVLFEATLISEGRGTTKPFEYLGSPKTNVNNLLKFLEQCDLPGVSFRPITYAATFHKFKQQQCQGVQIHVNNRDEFLPVLTGLALIQAFKENSEDFGWLDPPYEYEYDKMPIDILIGCSRFRELIDASAPFAEITDWLGSANSHFRV